MSDREISVDDVVRIFVAKAREAEGLFYNSVDGTEKVAADFTSMNDEEIAKWFIENGLVMNSGRLDTGIMQKIDQNAEVGQKTFNRPDEEDVENAYKYFMDKVKDSVTDNDYMDDENWDGRIGNPDERRDESKKYSSFEGQQTITENFRRFLNS